MTVNGNEKEKQGNNKNYRSDNGTKEEKLKVYEFKG